MRRSLSIVVRGSKVHCGIKLADRGGLSPLALDQNIKTHHTQFMLVTVNDEIRLYGITGVLPSQDTWDDLLKAWGQVIKQPVKQISLISGWTTKPHRGEIQTWLDTHLPDINPRPDTVTYFRLIEPFPLEDKENADA